MHTPDPPAPAPPVLLLELPPELLELLLAPLLLLFELLLALLLLELAPELLELLLLAPLLLELLLLAPLLLAPPVPPSPPAPPAPASPPCPAAPPCPGGGPELPSGSQAAPTIANTAYEMNRKRPRSSLDFMRNLRRARSVAHMKPLGCLSWLVHSPKS